MTGGSAYCPSSGLGLGAGQRHSSRAESLQAPQVGWGCGLGGAGRGAGAHNPPGSMGPCGCQTCSTICMLRLPAGCTLACTACAALPTSTAAAPLQYVVEPRRPGAPPPPHTHTHHKKEEIKEPQTQLPIQPSPDAPSWSSSLAKRSSSSSLQTSSSSSSSSSRSGHPGPHCSSGSLRTRMKLACGGPSWRGVVGWHRRGITQVGETTAGLLQPQAQGSSWQPAMGLKFGLSCRPKEHEKAAAGRRQMRARC